MDSFSPRVQLKTIRSRMPKQFYYIARIEIRARVRRSDLGTDAPEISVMAVARNLFCASLLVSDRISQVETLPLTWSM